VDLPFRLYVGQIPAGEIGAVLAHQGAWTLALVFFGRALLRRGARRLVVQGG
jgi:ABC-2 type transport system permease protein